MANKLHTDRARQLVYETINFTQTVRDTTDLEAATKTITATAKAGAADYSASLALTAAIMPDTRLAVSRIAQRLQITVDSFNSATHLYCQVYVDDPTGLVANNQLFSIDITATGQNLSTAFCTAATKPTLFNLLKDGASHTFYFFFWVNQATSATISECRLYEAIGVGSAAWYSDHLVLTFTGEIWVNGSGARIGTGNFSISVTIPDNVDGVGNNRRRWQQGNGINTVPNFNSTNRCLPCVTTAGIWLADLSVVTDLCYNDELQFILKS